MEAFDDRETLQSTLKSHITVFENLASTKIIPRLSDVAGQV